jgi:hypothetical protein
MNPHFVLFPGGYASGLMHIVWNDQGAAEPIPRNLLCADQGRPTDDFRKLFRSAFPTKEELPDLIATPDGKGTQRFLEVFR